MQEQLAGKIAVVTGGSSGIGRGISKRLAARGCHVIIIGRNETALNQTAAEISGTAVKADVTDADALDAVARMVEDRFGRLDILVNNAGIGPVGRIEDMTRADWKWLLDTNLWSVINGIDAFLPLLKANPTPTHILNTSSISGMFTVPTIGGYATTKYAVVALSEALAQETEQSGQSLSVSIFLPGPVRSNIHEGDRNRPAVEERGGLKSVRLEDAEGFKGAVIPWMEADIAGEIAVSAMLRRQLYIWTHPEGAQPIINRLRQIEQSITGTS